MGFVARMHPSLSVVLVSVAGRRDWLPRSENAGNSHVPRVVEST
jgi:hypothetical protein